MKNASLALLKRSVLVLSLLALSAFTTRTAHAQVSEADSLALIALYNATDGPNWSTNTNWLQGPLSTWHGVTVTDGRVWGLILSGNQLTGTIPSEIGDLTALTNWELSGNGLTGVIPDAIGRLFSLKFFSMNQNQLTGTIPAEVGQLTNLTSLNLNNNELTGALPAEIGQLTNLTSLSLSGNQLSGALPAEIGQLTNLTSLSLNNNELTGALPPEIGQLTSLEGLVLNDNQLTGALPAGFGSLTALQVLELNGNQLTGAIPPEIAQWPLVFVLALHDNQFTDLPDLSALAFVGPSVQNNRFEFDDLEPNAGMAGITYAPQDSVGVKAAITVAAGVPLTLMLDVGGAQNTYQWYKNDVLLDGETGATLTVAATGIGDAGVYRAEVMNARVTALTLQGRPTTVTVSNLVLMTDAQALVAFYNATGGPNWSTNTNWLQGPVSTWHGVTVTGGRVSSLVLQGNNLTGAIPAEIGQLTDLGVLDLHSNQLSGAIPAEIGQLSGLLTLNLRHNQLTGQIPVEIGQLTGLLNTLVLNNNQLTGQIPTEIGQLRNLFVLSLNDNQLSGAIPREVGRMERLSALFLSDNQLSGAIPSELARLTNLTSLSLNDNQLSGAIPPEIAQWREVRELALHNNRFTYLPNLSALGNVRLSVQNNRFEFDDLAPHVNMPRITYAPQDSVGAATTKHGITGRVTIIRPVGGTGNEYAWFKDGQRMQDVTGPTLHLPAATISDAGVYRADVTNPSVPDLTLTGRPVSVTLDDVDAASQQAALMVLAGAYCNLALNWDENRSLGEWEGVSTDDLSRVTKVALPERFDRNCTKVDELPEAFLDGLPYLQVLNLRGNGIAGAVPEELFYMADLRDVDLSYNRLFKQGTNLWGYHCGNDCLPKLDSLLAGYGSFDRGGYGSYGGEYTGSGGSAGPYTAPLMRLNLAHNWLTGGFPPPGFAPSARHPQYGGLNSFNVQSNYLTGNLTRFFQDASVVNQIWTKTPASCSSIFGEDSPRCSQPEGYARWTMKIADNGRKEKMIPRTIDTLPPSTGPSTFASGVAQSGAASGTQQIGGCEWGFSACAVAAEKTHIADALAYAVLDISRNDAEGEIPASMGDIPFLRILDMSINAFSGTLPEELGNLIYLDSLVLGHNVFTGPMPQSFTNLTNLTYFDFGASGVEAPTDPALQGWLGGINEVVSTSIEFAGHEDLPNGAYALSAVYPNPFGQVAHFTLQVETSQKVQIAVHNLMGQRIAVLHEGRLTPNTAHVFTLDGAALASGLYLIEVRGKMFSATGKAMVVR
ncbi:MAG: hypothetical protein RhofKO_26570 [Rhodothermales bacterium]